MPSAVVLICLFCCLFLSDRDAWCLASSGDTLAPVVNGKSAPAAQITSYTPEEMAWRSQHPTIKVSNEFDWPPFDFVVSGRPQGFGIDLMELLSKRSGITFEYVNGYTWDELVEMFFQGQIDLVHSLSVTPERQGKAFFFTALLP